MTTIDFGPDFLAEDFLSLAVQLLFLLPNFNSSISVRATNLRPFNQMWLKICVYVSRYCPLLWEWEAISLTNALLLPVIWFTWEKEALENWFLQWDPPSGSKRRSIPAPRPNNASKAQYWSWGWNAGSVLQQMSLSDSVLSQISRVAKYFSGWCAYVAPGGEAIHATGAPPPPPPRRLLLPREPGFRGTLLDNSCRGRLCAPAPRAGSLISAPYIRTAPRRENKCLASCLTSTSLEEFQLWIKYMSIAASETRLYAKQIKSVRHPSCGQLLMQEKRIRRRSPSSARQRRHLYSEAQASSPPGKKKVGASSPGSPGKPRKKPESEGHASNRCLPRKVSFAIHLCWQSGKKGGLSPILSFP